MMRSTLNAGHNRNQKRMNLEIATKFGDVESGFIFLNTNAVEC
jgi:hypothetical protein